MKTGGTEVSVGIRNGIRACGLVALLWAACGALSLHASELNPFEIALVEQRVDRYVEPVGGQIVIRSLPASLCVRIRNTSESSKFVRASPERAYSIELIDQAGRTSMIKRKKGTRKEGEDDIRVNLAPGADRIFPIQITPDVWDGIPEVVPGTESQYRARVVYETADGRLIYSPSYTLIFRLP
jgi:hypothetical protein